MNEEGAKRNYNMLHYNVTDDSLAYYSNEYTQADDGLIYIPPLLPLKDLIHEYVTNDQPFILVAPAGSGKKYVIFPLWLDCGFL